MTAHNLKYSDFFDYFNKADSREQQAVAIIDAFQQIQKENEEKVIEAKKEVLQEINLKDLATKQDLNAFATKLDLEKFKSATIKSVSMIILVGIWAPVLIGALVKFLA